MAPELSDVRCRCGRNAVEWVSFTRKNPGRRFLKCANRSRSCGFWEWVDEPLSPIVRSAIDVNLKKSEKKVKVLGCALVLSIAIMFFMFKFGRVDECKCRCNFDIHEIGPK